MNLPHLVAENMASQNSQGEAETQLHGNRLMLARTAWAILVVIALALCVANIPLNYIQYLTVCTLALCPNQLATPDMERALHSAGLSLQFYALYLTTLGIGFVLIFCAIGAIIAWRKSRNWMALLVSLTLIVIGTAVNTDYQLLATAYPITHLPGELVQFLLGTLPFLVGNLFPNGRFAPRWTRWMALLVVLFVGVGTFFPSSPLNIATWPGPLRTMAVLVVIVTLLFAQIYRYLRVSTPVQRQQTKWVVFGIMATIIYFIALLIFGTLYPAISQTNSLGSLFAEASYSLALNIVPLAIAFSILRYRLYDIDLLINRTLVYGTLTVLLTMIYFGLVIVLQSLIHWTTGQVSQNPVAVFATTLVIAALFQPLRRRIQRLIDRRFYRRKYDATRILATFSDTLRGETDLRQLSEQLVFMVDEAMQPTHVYLWLRKPEGDRKQPAWEAISFTSSRSEAKEV